MLSRRGRGGRRRGRPAGRAPRPGETGERGFALLAVLLVMALLAVIGTEFAYSMRLEASMVRSYRDSLVAMNLAEAGVEQAIREILTQSLLVGMPDDGPLTFYRQVGTTFEPLPLLPRQGVPLGSGQFSYRITDEASRIDLNLSPPSLIDALLTVLKVEKADRDTIVDSLQDWRDADELHRLNGAESEDYLTLPVPYRSRNRDLEDVRELLQIHGMTPAIFYGHDRIPGLVDFVTVSGVAQININTASETVLRALGLSDAEISQVVQGRRAIPYAQLPGPLGGRNLVVPNPQTQIFRIEAEGLVAGASRARLTAIVSRQPDGQDHDFTVLGWDPNLPAAAPESASDAH